MFVVSFLLWFFPRSLPAFDTLLVFDFCLFYIFFLVFVFVRCLFRGYSHLQSFRFYLCSVLLRAFSSLVSLILRRFPALTVNIVLMVFSYSSGFFFHGSFASSSQQLFLTAAMISSLVWLTLHAIVYIYNCPISDFQIHLNGKRLMICFTVCIQQLFSSSHYCSLTKEKCVHNGM